MKGEFKLNNSEVSSLSKSELLEINGVSIAHSIGKFNGKLFGYVMNDATNSNYTQNSGSAAMHADQG